MSDESIRVKWDEFITDPLYKEYLLDAEQRWDLNLDKVKDIIKNTGMLPKNNKYLEHWIGDQEKNYKKRNHIMQDPTYHKKWEHFKNDPKYKPIYNRNINITISLWNENFTKFKEYIDKNNKIPNRSSNIKEERILVKWLDHQKQNYKYKKGAMNLQCLYNTWTEFINDDKYKNLDNLLSLEELWKKNLQLLYNFIDNSNTLPQQRSKIPEEKVLGRWLVQQKIKYWRLTARPSPRAGA